MKKSMQIAVSLAVLTIGAIPVSACCFWPFGGMWGAGYYGAPVSAGYYGSPGYYSAGYAPGSTGFYSRPYSAGYASTGGCCVPICCDPCGGVCASGACTGSTSSGTLKPSTDPTFDKGTTDPDYDRDRANTREQELLNDPSDRELRPRSRIRTDDPIPEDEFRKTPANRTDPETEVLPFGTGTDNQINNKPPMPEVQDLPAAEPTGTGDEKTFLPELKEEAPTGPQTRREFRPTSLAERSSKLSEVIRSKRLASRSLPSTSSTQAATSFAGNSVDDKSNVNPPVRWISVPMPEGHVRL